MEFLLYLACGAAAGLLSGLFGVGGGIVIVPILAFIFASLHFPAAQLMHLALGTSLATIVLTSVASARAHHQKANVNWRVVRQISPAVVLGTLLGTLLVAHLHSVWLTLAFALFLLAVATQSMLNFQPDQHHSLPDTPGIVLVGALIGAASSLVGIGGGTLSVPFLMYCNFNARMAIGTSAAIGLPIALAGSAGYIYTGFGMDTLPARSLGFIYLPAFLGIAMTSVFTAPLGAALAHRLPAAMLKRLFALLLYLVAIKMLWRFL